MEDNGHGRIRRVYRSRGGGGSYPKKNNMRDDPEPEWSRVTIGFYAPSEDQQGGENKGWWASTLNWAVGRWTSRKGRNYSHVELRFNDLFSTSICQAENRVHMMDGKTMANPLYSAFLTLGVTKEQETTMRRNFNP